MKVLCVSGSKPQVPEVMMPSGSIIFYAGDASEVSSIDGWDVYSIGNGAFVKGAVSGGATLTLAGTNSNHSHTLPSTSTQGDHSHGVGGGTSSGGNDQSFYPTSNADCSGGGYHSHGVSASIWGAGGHSHTTPSTAGGNSVPPYFEMPLIKANKEVALPDKGVLIFDSLTIPANFVLCNGANGTPNLSNVFVRQPVTGYGTTGGSVDHSHTNSSLSTESVSSHSHSLGASIGSGGGSQNKASTYQGFEAASANHGHGSVGSGSSGAGGSHSHTLGNSSTVSNLPAYMNLAGMMKTSEADEIPDHTIMLFSSTSYPSGWLLCTGDEAFGLPDLTNRFVRFITSGTIKEVGGASTHTHTTANTAAGGYHGHTGINGTTGTASKVWVTVGSGGTTTHYSHTHGWWVNVSDGNSHSHTVGTSGSTNNEPSHVKLYFIQKNYGI